MGLALCLYVCGTLLITRQRTRLQTLQITSLRETAEFAVFDNPGVGTDDITAQLKVRNLNVMVEEQ